MWNVISLWFWFVFPWWLVRLSIFSWVYWPFLYPLWRSVVSVLYPLLCQVVCCCWVLGVIYIFWILCLIWCMIWKYFLPECRLPFYSVDNVFWCTKFLIIMKSNLSVFSYVACTSTSDFILKKSFWFLPLIYFFPSLFCVSKWHD